MKRIVRLTFLAGIVVAALLLAGCSAADETTIRDRINLFVNDMNNNRGSVWENFHPDSSAYTQRRDANTWSADFPADETIAIAISSIDGSTVSARLSSSKNTYSESSISFQMRNDPEDGGGLFGGGEVDNWKILSISGAVTVN